MTKIVTNTNNPKNTIAAAKTLISWQTANPHNRPEVDLLLCCGRTQLNPAIADYLQILVEQEIDWIYLIRIAEQHGIMQLLYHNLNHTCAETLPQAVLQKLRLYSKGNTIRNQSLTNQLIELLQMFNSHNISTIPFKGPILATSAYGNLNLRQFCDLDILFHKKDVSKAKDLLIAQGYKNAEGLTQEQEIAQLESPYVKAYTYERKDSGVTVELHWKLRATYSAFPLDYESLWERLQSLSLNGETVLKLSPEDEILYLCVHGCGDRWRKFLQIVDLAEFLRTQQNINWQKVIEQAKGMGCRRRLYLGLFLAQDLLEAEIPEQVCKQIQGDTVVKSLAKWIYTNLFHRTETKPTLLEQALFDLRMMERRQDRVRYCIDRTILLIAKKYRLGFAKKYGLPGR